MRGFQRNAPSGMEFKGFYVKNKWLHVTDSNEKMRIAIPCTGF